MRNLITVSVALGAMLCTPQAFARDCQTYSVEAVQAAASDYDPASPVGALVSVQIAPTSTVDQDCRNLPVIISTEDGAPASFENGNADLDLDLQQSPLTSNLSFLGALLTGNGRNELVRGGVTVPLFIVRPGQFVPAGIYRERLTVKVGDAPVQPIDLIIQVRTAIRLVPQNGSSVKSISFGEVSQGSERTSSIYYVANGPFQVRLSSENRGELLHEAGRSLGSIPYATSYAGQTVDLSGGPSVIEIGPSGRGVQVDDLILTIAPQTGKYAGKYLDVLTLDYIAY